MWTKSKFSAWRPALLILPALITWVNAAAPAIQEQPVALDETAARLWEHYVRPLRLIHTPAAKELGYGNYVVLEVTVSVGGNVESARAMDGPKQFFSDAEQVERDRQFKPFEQDGIPVRALIKDYVRIVPQEEWAKTRIPFPEIKSLDSLRISLNRTTCYGTCPSYSVEVRGSGEVIYRGNQFVLITGEHHAKVSPDSVAILLQAFRSTEYFSLKDKYAESAIDIPTYTTAIEFDGQKKTVVDYAGSEVGMPDVVTELEDQIDEVTGTGKWLRETGQTWPALVAERWNFRADTEENRALFANVAAEGSVELIQRFIANGAPVLLADKNGASPVENAAAKGDLGLIRRMLRNQPQLPASVLFRTLRAAAHSGNVDLMEFLIAKGASVNGASDQPNDHRETVLMSAARSCKKAAIEEALRYHPAVHAQDRYGNSVLSSFLKNCYPPVDIEGILELLISAGADVNLRDSQQQTSIFKACFNSSAVSILAGAGADLNTRDRNGSTPLMSCVTTDFAKAMITAGADLSAKDRYGLTAAEEARQMGNTSLADVLDAATKVASKPGR